MDYWPRLNLTLHDDTPTFFSAISSTPFWLFSTKGTQSLWTTRFSSNDCLVFGSETSGIDADLLARFPTRVVRIPQRESERCLNLSTAAGIALYEALRQLSA